MYAFGSKLILGRNEDTQRAKLEYKQDLYRMTTQKIDEQDEYWRHFWQIFDSSAEMTSLLPSELLRAVLQTYPDNLITLVKVVAEHLFELVASSEFPTPKPAVTPAATSSYGLSYFAAASKQILPNGDSAPAKDSTREVLNCVRVLTRCLPFLYEKLAASSQISTAIPQEQSLEQRAFRKLFNGLFWTPIVASARESALPEKEQFVIDDEEEEEEITARIGDMSAESLPTFAEKLLNAAIDLLFCSGFTIPALEEDSSRKIRYAIWQAGIGSTNTLQSDRAQLSNRTETLRLLLTLLSVTMYAPASENKFLKLLLSLADRKIALTLLCSLLNTALDDSALQEAQISTANAYKKLASLTLSVEQKHADQLARQLPLLCCQTLDVLLIPHDFTAANKPGSHSPLPSPTLHRTFSTFSSANLNSSTSSAKGLTVDDASKNDNVFRFYLSKLHRQSDLAFLTDHIFALISRPPPTHLIPGTTPNDDRLLTEAVILLWRLAECNKNFLGYILDNERSPDLLVCLLNICLDVKDNASQFGLVRLCAFTLQSFSAERGFGSRLNGPLIKALGGSRHAPAGLPQTAKVGDFLILTVYTLIFQTDRAFNTIYPALILLITNCSPYLKGLSVSASTRLLQLFLAFSTPSFVLAEDSNPRLLYYLIEAFNNIIYHQLSDNPQVIYAIIQSHRRFESLANFTLRGAVDDIRRIRADRKVSLDSVPNSAVESPSRPEFRTTSSTTSLVSIGTITNEEKGFDTFDETEDPVRMSEKARGKMRERSNSVGGDAPNEDADYGFPGPYRSKSGFIPTESWVASWREHLPLDSILIMLTELRPKVASLCSVSSPSTNQAVVDFLKSVTLIDVLPHRTDAFKARRFSHSAFSIRWLCSVIWSRVYVSPSTSPFFNGTNVRLFSVVAPEPPALDLKQAAAALTSRLSSSENRRERTSREGVV